MEPKILIVDDDPWMQREVLETLGGRGWELTVAANGVTALARACVRRPDLILSDVVMPVMDGWTLLTRVRQHSRLAPIPFVLMTSKSEVPDLQRGFRLGADDYVPKPFDPKELVHRVDHLLYRRPGTTGAYVRPGDVGALPSDLGFTGDLQDLGVTALLSFLDLEHKTGMVIVRSGGERGRVFVREGRVYSARIDRGPQLCNAEAVYWMLRWTTGKFEFRSLLVEMTDEVQTPTSHLLLEGARQIDEARQRAAAAP